MAITKSAKKALRQSKRKKVTNDARKTALRAALKDVRRSTTADAKEVAATLAAAYKAIDKAQKRGLLKKNTAARRKSKVARALKAKTV